jgi:hypothetical protein
MPLVQKKNISGSGASLPTTFDSNVVAGNFLLLALIWGDSTNTAGTCTDNHSRTWTKLIPVQDSGQSVVFYYLENATAGATTVTPTLSGSSSFVEVIAYEWTGILSSASIDGNNEGFNSAGPSPINSGPITTTVSDLLFGACATFGTISGGEAGWTYDPSITGNATEYLEGAAAGTYSATWTQSPGKWVATIAAFKLTSGTIRHISITI